MYGGYKTCQEPNVFFVPFLTDENGHNTATNEPAQDPDIPAAHYYGSASRSNGNWVSSLRGSHFSSWARRDIIPTRLASAILLYAGRKSLLAAPSGSALPATTTTTTTNDTAAAATLSYTPKVDEVGYNGRRGDGTLQQQGWRNVSGGTFTPKTNPDGKGGHVLAITKTPQQAWKAEQPVVNGADLLKHGGVLECKFRLTTPKVANQYAFACYWLLNASDVPAGVRFEGSAANAHPGLSYFFIQTDGTNINLMAHASPNNLKMGTFGAYNTDWHTFKVEYHGGNTSRATLFIDNGSGNDFTLMNCPAIAPVNTVQLTDITSSNTYGIELAAFSATVYRDDATLTLKDTDASSYVYFPAGTRGGKVVIPDTKISAGNTVQIVANSAGTITVQPANGNVLINGLPSSTTTDHSTTLVQTGMDGKSWVVT
ncbi:hypothetical protein NE92_16575 [Salmonella enterica]|nr:hypothetical protein [Salmonella enterica]